MAQKDQKETWSKDSKGSGNAETGNNYLAYSPLEQTVSISLRYALSRTETGRPSVAKGGFRRHLRQSSLSKTRKTTLEIPKQDKGETMIVGHSYSLASCSSTEPASASLDENVIAHKKGKETKNTKIQSQIVCLSNRLRTIP